MNKLGGYVTSPKLFVGKKMEIDEDGLLSESIFGPINPFRCKCGKLNSKVVDNDGEPCPKCGVLCTNTDLRVKTFGKIKLTFPCIKPTKKHHFKKPPTWNYNRGYC